MSLSSINSSTKFKEWITVINSILSQLKTATQAEAGLLSAEDKKKLDSISEGASSVDVEQLSMGVSGNSQVTLISGNTEAMNEVSFVAGKGITISQKIEDNNSSKSLGITISGTTYEKATPATEYDDGSIGLVQATAGNSNRMLFSDMEWKEAVLNVSQDNEYPVSSGAVYTALQEKTDIYHASEDSKFGVANSTLYGHVKLTDAYSEDSVNSGLAVTPKGLLLVQKLAQEANERSKQNEIDINAAEQRLSTAYRYMGSVYSYDSLPTEGNEIGDVYNVMFPNGTDGANYAWNGSQWDSQSGIFAVDSSVIEGSVNPVSSNAVFQQLSTKAPIYHAFEIPAPTLPEEGEGEEGTEGEEGVETIAEETYYVNYGVGSSVLYGHIKLTDDYMTVSSVADSGIGASAFAVYSIYAQLLEVKATADRTANWTLFSDLSEAVYPSLEGDENILATKVVISQINEKIDTFNAEYDEYVIQNSNKIAEIEETHSNDIITLNSNIETQVTAINAEIALVREEHAADLEALESSLTESISTTKTELLDEMETLDEELRETITSTKDALNDTISTNKTAADNGLSELGTALDEHIENYNTLVETVSENQSACDTRFEEVNTSIQAIQDGTTKTVETADGSISEIAFNPASEATALECVEGTEYTLSINTPSAITSTFYVIFRNGSNASFVWPSSVKFSNDMEVELTAGIDILRFFTIDSGTTWYVIHEFSSANA